MKAMILAAGLGTRLKPWTLSHPKALVPVGGVPMLERVIVNLRKQGFDYIVVNVHHFAGQILEFLDQKDFGVEIAVSDETDRLLDTGGAILNARKLLRPEDGPVLVHNVDILSNADLGKLVDAHNDNKADSTLLVSDRVSTRKLIFDDSMNLKGWHHLTECRYLPEDFLQSDSYEEYSFSGIHVVGKKAIDEMNEIEHDGKFSIIDYLLSPQRRCVVKGYFQRDLRVLDIGKPATLSQANELI